MQTTRDRNEVGVNETGFITKICGFILDKSNLIFLPSSSFLLTFNKMEIIYKNFILNFNNNFLSIS